MRSPAEKDALIRLAVLVGIEPTYEDVFFTVHEVADDVLAAILRAMGFDASTPEAVERTYASYTRSVLERGLEPVCVIASGEPVAVTVTLPRQRPATPLRWTVTAEDGATRTGEFATAGVPMETIANARDYGRLAVPLAASSDDGYFALEIADGAATYRSQLIVAPAACYVPEALQRQRLWGLAAHVYALRSRRTRIAGDFADLATLCAHVRDAGGSAVAVNPLHLLPRGADSPYGPSSRTYVNWAYLDVAALPGYDASDAASQIPDEAELVDYAALYRERYDAARRAFDRFEATGDAAAATAFANDVRARGAVAHKAATFEVLAERFRVYAGADDWRTWPDAYRDHDSAAVAAFARDNAREVAFHQFLQWQCDVQLERVARACGDMPIGLYRDLAVGTQLGGVDTWLSAGELAHAAQVGAPPDLLNPGQAWGVAPFDPLVLRAQGYRPFADLLRANARHAGALRIDHVMGLLRLWWVPAGFAASDGAYVSYALDEMLAVLALESHRAKCLIVGEDLGTVPPGLRERLEAARVFSYRVLQFEREADAFIAPEAYPVYALASTGTHDLPTITGFWTGADIDLREGAPLAAGDTRSPAARAAREVAKSALRAAFTAAGIAHDDASIAFAANAYLARTPSLLLMLTLEDVLGDTAQLNLPASDGSHPNWRRRTPVTLESLPYDPRFVAIASAVREAGRAARS